MSINTNVKTVSIGEYLINTYGKNAIEKYWSCNNIEDPFEVAYKSNRKFWFKCGENSTHLEYQRTPDKVVRSDGRITCPICAGHKVVKGINDIATTHPHLVEHFVNTEDGTLYTYSSRKKVLMKCPDCGESKYLAIYSLYNDGFSCDACGDGISYPNKFMYNLLAQLNLDFVTEYAPSWAIDDGRSQRRYDFYIPSKNLIIEMDGGLGHGKGMHNSANVSIEESVLIDQWKNHQANNHNLEVIRVDCDYKSKSRFEYIKQNTIASIGHLIGDACIDWMCIESCCVKSLIKEICEQWDTGLYDRVSDLSLKFKISGNTIRKYLKVGTKHGWCNYDPVKEVSKNGTVNGIKSSKPVLVFKDGVFVGEFNSCTELVNKSFEFYGVHFTAGRISSVCTGKCKTHKGYVVKFKEGCYQ